MSAGKTEEMKPARRAAPASPAAPAAGWCVGGTCRASAPPSRKARAPKPWGLKDGPKCHVPAPTPSSICEWRAAWDLSAKG